MLRYIYFTLIIGITLFSCVPHKKLVYLQSNVQNDTLQRTISIYKVQPKDILYISVSSYNTQLTDFFNVKSEQGTSTDFYYSGYSVNSAGYIHIPILDSIHVEGLSIQEIQTLLHTKIGEYVKGPNVIVKLVNFKVTVLGEVAKAGPITVEANEFTILEAIASAGDVRDLADRKNIKLIRKEGDISKVVRIDLTDQNLISSPYFYLQPNDVIYVEPLKQKAIRENIRTIATGFGFVTGIVIVLRFIVSL